MEDIRSLYAGGVTQSHLGRYGRDVDLRAFLLDAHDDLRGRLHGSVVRLVPSDQWTVQPDSSGSSIGWLLLHLARHQDLALNTVIRNHPPLFAKHRVALGLADAPEWAGLTEHEDRNVTAALPSDALLAYVDAVFDASRHWLDHLSPMAMETVPDTPRRLESLAGLPPHELGWLFSMWGSRTVGWFVQWPIVGHGNAHVGEAISVRNRLGLSPF